MQLIKPCLQTISEYFWHERLWLPPNITWNDITYENNFTYADHLQLLFYSLPIAVGIFVFRYTLEKYCFIKIGLGLGLRGVTTKKPLVANARLEEAFKNDKIHGRNIVLLAQEIKWSQRNIERWCRQRRRKNHPNKLKKFSETLWKCCYYTTMFSLGLAVLWNKNWFWDWDRCWDNYPYADVTIDIKIYYIISLGFYWSLCISQFWDVCRKDFWQMFLHHVLTITLLCLSWVCNLLRIGSLVLNLHDFADIFLEFAKVTRYLKLERISTIIFIIFLISWIVTRNIIFPFWIINSTMSKPPVFPAYFLFNGLLVLLFFLHIYWTRLLLHMAYRSFLFGEMDKDIRSSSSSSDFVENDESKKE